MNLSELQGKLFSKQGTLVCNNAVVFPCVHIAKTFMERLKGLQGVRELPEGYALLFRDCSSVHCVGMRIPICVAYLSAEDVCLGFEILEPGRLGHAPKGTDTVVETAVENQGKWVVGQRYEFKRTLSR